jgi:hypothetical protein
MNLARTQSLMPLVFSVGLSMLAGCACGFGGRQQLERCLSEIKPGASGTDAFAHLEHMRFSTRFESPTRIVGTRTDGLLGFIDLWADLWTVRVDLDDAQRVISTQLFQDQTYP